MIGIRPPSFFQPCTCLWNDLRFIFARRRSQEGRDGRQYLRRCIADVRHEARLVWFDNDHAVRVGKYCCTAIHLIVSSRLSNGYLSWCRIRNEGRLMIGASNTDGGSRCLDLVVVFVHAPDCTGDGTEAALEQGDEATLRAICLAAIQEGGDAQLGIWTDRKSVV